MAYHTTPYLLLFLPAALLFYQITPAKWRSYTLLIFSYLNKKPKDKLVIVFIFKYPRLFQLFGIIS